MLHVKKTGVLICPLSLRKRVDNWKNPLLNLDTIIIDFRDLKVTYVKCIRIRVTAKWMRFIKHL